MRHKLSDIFNLFVVLKVGDTSEKYTNKQNHMKMKFAFPHNRYLHLDTLSNLTSFLRMTAFNA